MVKEKNLALCIILSIVTCGIYMYYWIVCLTDDTNEIAGEPEDTSGVIALVLTIVTCGIYGLYWAYKRGVKFGVLYLILYIFGGIIALALIQNEVNKFAQ